MLLDWEDHLPQKKGRSYSKKIDASIVETKGIKWQGVGRNLTHNNATPLPLKKTLILSASGLQLLNQLNQPTPRPPSLYPPLENKSSAALKPCQRKNIIMY
jgi:hypothetical protein